MSKPRKYVKNIIGLFSTVKWCLSLTWKSSKLYTVVRLCAEVFTPLLVFSASFIGKHVIDLLSNVDRDVDSIAMLLPLLLALLGVALARAGLQKSTLYAQVVHSDILVGEVSLMMMERALSVDLEYYDNPDYYDKLQSATRDSVAISSITWSALSCISALVSFVAAFTLLCSMNALYGVSMAIAAVPSSIAGARYTKLLYKLSLDQVNEERQANYYCTIASERDYAQDMRLFDAGGRLMDRYRRVWFELFSKRRSMVRGRAVLTGLLEFMPEITSALIGIDIAFMVLHGNATVGDYSLYTGLVWQLWAAISGWSLNMMQVYNNRLKIDNIKTLYTFESHVADNGRASLASIETIQFDHIRFTYPSTSVLALDDVCFVLRKEEKTALVGLNGSGKTTLIKLLLRLYDPDSGCIYINGRDAREYKLSDLRSCFSVYFQDMSNYCLTIRENLEIADDGIEDIEEAAAAALNAAYGGDILKKAVKKLETSITRHFDPEGVELSGGQHQKLALARALFRRHSALVLDEPSSNLDPVAEHEIFESLRRLTEDKLTIFTSHRLSNVYLADRVIVLEDGRVVEDGTQVELLLNNQRYAELFRYQQERYMTT